MKGRNKSSSALVAIVVMAALLLVDHGAHGAITSCSQLSSMLTPCAGYLFSGGSVPAACCSGVRSLVAAMRTSQDRRTACSCMKSAFMTKGISGAVFGRAGGLPRSCGVNSPFNISPSTDCNRLK